MNPEQPETITHPVFGECRWEEERAVWFTQIRDAAGKWLDVSILLDEGDQSAALDRAADLYTRAIQAERQLLCTAAENELLELYNDTWRRSDEPELKADEFISRLEFTYIQIRPDWDTAVILSYEAGELFAGHAVDVELDRHLRYRDVDLIG